VPKNPTNNIETRYFPNPKRATFSQLISPLLIYGRCESPAYVRHSLERAMSSNQLPDSKRCSLGTRFRRSKDEIEAVKSEEHMKRAAIIAATKLKNARVLFEQATQTIEEVRPVSMYYGTISFLDFVTSCVVRRKRKGNPGHGLSVICGDDGWKFNRDWPRKNCYVEMGSTGDFPFYVDALTIAGWPSLFSGFRLHQDTTTSPLEVIENPAPLLKAGKLSLDLLCNFDRDMYMSKNTGVREWLKDGKDVSAWRVTAFLLDVAIVYVASSLARYYIPAWREIVEGIKSDVYGDIKDAYETVIGRIPFFFSDVDPFPNSFQTRIGP